MWPRCWLMIKPVWIKTVSIPGSWYARASCVAMSPYSVCSNGELPYRHCTDGVVASSRIVELVMLENMPLESVDLAMIYTKQTDHPDKSEVEVEVEVRAGKCLYVVDIKSDVAQKVASGRESRGMPVRESLRQFNDDNKHSFLSFWLLDSGFYAF